MRRALRCSAVKLTENARCIHLHLIEQELPLHESDAPLGPNSFSGVLFAVRSMRPLATQSTSKQTAANSANANQKYGLAPACRKNARRFSSNQAP